MMLAALLERHDLRRAAGARLDPAEPLPSVFDPSALAYRAQPVGAMGTEPSGSSPQALPAPCGA
jgi:hypothetical protein